MDFNRRKGPGESLGSSIRPGGEAVGGDDDVEGHGMSIRNPDMGPDGIGRRPQDDDVEGHMTADDLGTQGIGSSARKAIDDGSDDDVEGHIGAGARKAFEPEGIGSSARKAVDDGSDDDVEGHIGAGARK